MKRRSYQGPQDVALLQAFNAAAIADTGGCGYLHTGDIPHRIFNGNRRFDPAEVLTIWEDDDGVAAWVLVGPRHRGYDAQVRPNCRGGAFEREVLVYAENRTLALVRHHGIRCDKLFGATYRSDEARAELTRELGWVPDGEPPSVLNRATLSDPDMPQVPSGYVIRSVGGLHEAAALGEVHAASFGSTWTPETYRKLMQSPGYAMERELVVEAADGTYAGFTMTWYDDVNRMGLLEPVGIHPDHRRLGLGRALVLAAVRHMADGGLETALVVNEGTNDAARGLYRGCGFKPWQLIDGYVKPVGTRTRGGIT